MPLGPRSVSPKGLEENLGSLRSCLVEGDTEQRSRERRVRRRSLLISVVVQAVVLALLVLVPLFGKSAHIALAITTPIPPYGPSGHPHGDRRPHNSGTTSSNSRFHYDVSRPISQPTPAGESSSASNLNGDPMGNLIDQGPACSGCVDIGGRNSGPRPPQPPATETPARPAILHFTHLDPAMLIRRVEPAYPRWQYRFTVKGGSNSGQLSPPTARFVPWKLCRAIQSSTNLRWRLSASGATSRRFSTANPWKSTRTSPSSIRCRTNFA